MPKQAAVARLRMNPAASRIAGLEIPRNSSSGTRTRRPMGRCTAKGWNRPRNCSQSPCGCPSRRDSPWQQHQDEAKTTIVVCHARPEDLASIRPCRSPTPLFKTLTQEALGPHLPPVALSVVDPTPEGKYELVVVNAEAMENCSVEVSHVYRIVHDVIAVVVGLGRRSGRAALHLRSSTL